MISIEKFNKIRNLYWVYAPVKENFPAHFDTWVLSSTIPLSTNKAMHWRHPTWIEAYERQLAYNKNPTNFILTIQRMQTLKYEGKITVLEGETWWYGRIYK